MPATAPPVEEEETEANKLLFPPLPIGAQLNTNPELKCSEHIGRALWWRTAMAPKQKHRQIAT